MELRNMVIAFVVIGLFAFAFISFGVSFQQEWGAEQTITDNTHISSIYSGVNDSIESSYQSSEEQKGSMTEEEPGQSGSVSELIMGAISNIAKVFTGVIDSVFGAITKPLLKALGLPQQVARIVGIVLSTILAITTTLLIWKLFKLGR